MGFPGDSVPNPGPPSQAVVPPAASERIGQTPLMPRLRLGLAALGRSRGRLRLPPHCGGTPALRLGLAALVAVGWMAETAKVVNTSAVVVLDGGGKVTLSGADQRRILYMNTCDQAQIWTTSHCQDQEQPQLTIQRMSFTQGNSTGDTTEGGGGGAVFVRGGRVKVIDSRFTANQCDAPVPILVAPPCAS
jgi:hypothetical protein